MHLVQVEAAGRGSLCSRKRLAQHLGGDEGIAVAVAADPAADAQERGQLGVAPGRVGRRELVFERRIEARQLAQERGVVIGEAVRDLVEDSQPGPAQDAGLP